MSVKIKVPMLPESVAEAVVAVWHKAPGDMCQEGDVIAELETDKVMLEVVATSSGVLTQQLAAEGDAVTADHILAEIDTDGVVDEAASEPPAVATVAEPTQVASSPEGFVNASPSVRREIHDKNITLDQVKASGRGGRVRAEDLHAPNDSLRRVKMSRMRAKIAERLVEAQQTAAMLTTFNEVNMAPIMQLRSENQEKFMEKYGVKLGFMSFFVQAVTHALNDFPEVGAFVDGEDILYPEDANIGIAVSTDRGLVVPVLKQAQHMSYADIEGMIKAYAGKAREGKITLDDMSGGNFTITNGGVFGSMLSTPILNMPQSAILGMHAIQKRAVVENDAVVIRPMMYLALSYDHRLIDGQQSVQFLVTVKDLLENPNKLLLDI
ncbi:dihydrolipoyllysine-residue succinyltransferase [Candidatus Synchoanobacter obligatus]|uniref:Dihydrolipoyllysine-residue succinyltransferase component of 2-oxoglutarate dehydrogenase complex n=1 Tax=Candidatus Synchoanobacter obligatus TaxID=2919597 RepID=A0ABT1L3V4_9GAMM|nr:dihydrolipoyllysine-residue succinyltransferase [Candidatus Synchoanobacter obligatus]MCP8351866.1 dihydrolipoyllysine-residue succinyltransferase [Candidatus Synchoanobacter obligatus]